LVLSKASFAISAQPNKKTSIKMQHAAGKVSFQMASKNLSLTVGEINQEETIHFFSNSEWSMPDLIDYITNQIGPCSLRLTSFSFTLPALVHIKNLIELRLINKVQFLIDKSVLHQQGKIQQLKLMPIEVKLLKCHAKIVLLENENYKLVVVSSANINRNPRWEAGSIMTSKLAYDFYSNKYDEIWNNTPTTI
jgi:hypothetical protein